MTPMTFEEMEKALIKQKEINSKLVQAVEWLTTELADVNKWAARANGEMKNAIGGWDQDAVDANNEFFWKELRKIIPSNLLEETTK